MTTRRPSFPAALRTAKRPGAALVLYRGPSRYDPTQTIRAVLVTKSRNSKTGRMGQVFVLPEDTAPHTAQRTGADAAVCGQCPLRPALGGGCYVVTCQGPLSTWKATRGQAVASLPEVAHALASVSALRLGAYGDVAALPVHMPGILARMVDGRVTGYTHGHLALGLDGVANLRTLCMLSVQSAAEASAAHAAGWRTFRVTAPDEANLPREVSCPSPRVECAQCLLCRGASLQARSVTIPAHGTFVRKALAVVAS